MDLILCHTTADFDTLGAAVGLTHLIPGAKIVLTGGCHPAVRDFLALHRDEYPLIERRSVNPEHIRSITVVDAQRRDRLGKAAEWLDLPNVRAIALYDHHMSPRLELSHSDLPRSDLPRSNSPSLDSHYSDSTGNFSDIPATTRHIEAVGAVTTLIVERLMAEHAPASYPVPKPLTPFEATVMALGIHVDTGSLTFGHTTPRDAYALAWLMTQGASIAVIGDYVEPGLSPELQTLLTTALDRLQSETVQGYTLAWVLLQTNVYIPGLSGLASELLDLTAHDVLLLAVHYPLRSSEEGNRLTLIGRSCVEGVHWGNLLRPLGGGGHARAATVTLRSDAPEIILGQILAKLKDQLPHPLTARELMSSPVRTVRPHTSILEAQRILLRYGHSGLSVMDDQDRLVGIISRRDIDIALHHGFGHAPVKGYMTISPKTISPETTLPDIESLMVTYDIGRLPVLSDGQLVGIVSRTDVLRQLHRDRPQIQHTQIQHTQIQGYPDTPHSGDRPRKGSTQIPLCSLNDLRDRLAPALWSILETAAQAGEQRGWHLYLVGGAVRDLFLADPDETLMLSDIDLVVDGFYNALTEAAGVELAQTLQQQYPEARLDIHGRFQTAALLWHHDPVLGSLWIDIATARTEFYPYPAANPEVEASSIHQDLYRRDFTINALALRLTHPRAGELLDFFGGCLDLQSRSIRVLHSNSFIEDPTRIYRAVRFAVRLQFQIEPQTERLIRYAVDSGVYIRTRQENHLAPALQTRLKTELKYILQAPYWPAALQQLADLGALQCIHPSLTLTPQLWHQLRLLSRGLGRLDPDGIFPHWQLRLEVLIAALLPGDRPTVAANLQLPDDSIFRLGSLERYTQSLEAIFAPQTHAPQTHAPQTHSSLNTPRPSTLVQTLQAWDGPTLALIAVRSSWAIRRHILHFWTQWRHLKPPLDGNDLKTLGYKPGPQFRQILDHLLAALLDGEITSGIDSGIGPGIDPLTTAVDQRERAIAFLQHHYPLPSQP